MNWETIEKIVNYIDRISYRAAYISSAFCILMLVLVLAEIFCRTFLEMSLLITIELSEWLFIAMVFTGTAWTLKAGGHIRINLVSSRLPQRVQHWLSLGAGSIGLMFFIWFSIYAWDGLIEKYLLQARGYSPIYHMPMWWAWVFLCIGTVLVAMQFVSFLLENVISLKKLGYERPWPSLNAILLIVAILGVGIWMYLSLQITGLGWLILILLILVVLFGLITSSMWIFLSLMVTGVMALAIFTPYPIQYAIPQIVFSANGSFILICLPLFIFMGQVLFLSGASDQLYSGISSWVQRLPGRLLQSNIIACTLFAAISGSSTVTCATIASTAIPELERRGYNRRIAIGSLAGAGTLGLLIPPSIMLILYGALTGTSIGQLFLAGIIPGLVISAMFMSYIGVIAIYKPSLIPPRQEYTWIQRAKGLAQILPIFAVIFLVLGLIYMGITTPTEAAAIGATCALVLALAYRRLNRQLIKEALLATTRITCMDLFIYIGAVIMSSALAYLVIPQHLAEAISALAVSRYVILGILCFVYILLGCIFDGITMLVLTLPVIFPFILELGFDPIWFGVILTILVEAAQVTPPVGLNLFVLQAITGEDVISIARSSIPFFLILLLGVFILTLFPDLATWLPSMM